MGEIDRILEILQEPEELPVTKEAVEDEVNHEIDDEVKHGWLTYDEGERIKREWHERYGE